MSANKVFGCDELRGEILSYLPRYCLQCKNRMGNINYPHSYKLYHDSIWKRNECKRLKGYCNWCYYYVFEYID